MKGGQSSDQWMKNALATGAIVPPPGIQRSGHRRLLDRAWAVVFALGIAAIGVAVTFY